MSFNSYFNSSAETNEFQHDLESGDHVIRWTRIVIYPIQVHGIVLSAVDNAVTIVDFGVSSDALGEKTDEAKSNDGPETTRVQSLDQDTALEDAMSAEEKEMMKVCENYGASNNRINIISITEMKDIKQWKKVNYGKKIKKGWKWWWTANDKDIVENSVADADAAKSGQVNKDDSRTNGDGDNKDDNSTEPQPLIEAADLHLKESSAVNIHSKPQTPTSQTSPKDTPSINMQPPELPGSDPKVLVLARVRYLLHDPSVLPKHNLFFSNSECIAVWCKTGRWSTLQASIFLGSQVAGQLKSTATIATVVGNVTVTQVVPAGGAAGWFGLTTTTTVGLLTVQPWLIPVLAGYGLLAVGTPLFLLRKAKTKWEKNTRKLTDGFWGWADNDVYVEAIKKWSAVGR